MRIGDTPVELEERSRTSPVTAARSAEPVRADQVSLSSRPAAPAEARPQAAAKVAELRERVRSGQYSIEVRALAERIVEDELLRAGVGG